MTYIEQTALFRNRRGKYTPTNGCLDNSKWKEDCWRILHDENQPSTKAGLAKYEPSFQLAKVPDRIWEQILTIQEMWEKGDIKEKAKSSSSTQSTEGSRKKKKPSKKPLTQNKFMCLQGIPFSFHFINSKIQFKLA